MLENTRKADLRSRISTDEILCVIYSYIFLFFFFFSIRFILIIRKITIHRIVIEERILINITSRCDRLFIIMVIHYFLIDRVSILAAIKRFDDWKESFSLALCSIIKDRIKESYNYFLFQRN